MIQMFKNFTAPPREGDRATKVRPEKAGNDL